jgi:GTP pyrophosphokinase
MDHTKVGVRIGNERNVMIRLARCCRPVPGDRIIGFVSRGRGIIVHREGCPNLKGIQDFEERRMEVEWETTTAKYTSSLTVKAHYRADLFSEIEGAIRKHGGHLISGSLNETERGDLDGLFTIEMDRPADLKKITRSIRTIPAIIHLQKTRSGQDTEF